MAERPVFIPSLKSYKYFDEISIKFDWYSGYSLSQKQKSITSLHKNAKLKLNLKNILEISTKSERDLGKALSAFNLLMHINKNIEIPVEAAYQGSKVFEHGGPYIDLYNKMPLEIKKDERLKNSGNLIYFKFKKTKWELNPKTAFYDWLYITALSQNTHLSKNLINFDAFTDIAFNPSLSLNCQARSAALFTSLYKRNLLKKSLLQHTNFLKLYTNLRNNLNEPQLDIFKHH